MINELKLRFYLIEFHEVVYNNKRFLADFKCQSEYQDDGQTGDRPNNFN